MENRYRRIAVLLLIAGLALALLGQYVLSHQREAWRVGVLAFVAAGGLLAAMALVAMGTSSPVLARSARWRALAMAPLRTALLLVAAAGLVAWATYLAHWRESRCAVLPWLLGIVLGVVALWRPRRRVLNLSQGWWAGWKTERAEIVGVALLVVAALALRLVGLADFPTPMSGDEGTMAMEAQRVLEGRWVNPFGTGWFSHPNLYFYLLAASLRVLGWNLFALRFPSALLGALGVAAVYLLARGLFGRETAWASALFLAGWSLPLHFSRLALNNGADVLFGALVLAFLQRGLVRGQRWAFVAAGLALGMSFHFYFGTRFLVLLVPAAVALSGWNRLARRWRGLLVLAVIALLVAGPLVVHFVRRPDDFVARAATDGLFQSGQLQTEQSATGKSVPLLLLEHLWRAATAFVYTLDQGYFYTGPAPMLQVFSGALFVLGLELALFRLREPRYLGLLIWVGLVVLVSGVLVKSPPGYHRYLIAAPAVCLLVGRTLVVIVRQLTRALCLSSTFRHALVLLLAAGLTFSGAWHYFAVYAPSGAFADRSTEIADRAARLMVELGPSYRTYFLGVPLMQLNCFNSVRFLAPDAEWVDVVDDLPEGWDQVSPGEGVLFIALPERLRALDWVHEQCPGGEEGVTMGRRDGLLFYTYLLAPDSTCLPSLEAP